MSNKLRETLTTLYHSYGPNNEALALDKAEAEIIDWIKTEVIGEDEPEVVPVQSKAKDNTTGRDATVYHPAGNSDEIRVVNQTKAKQRAKLKSLTGDEG